MLCDTLCCGTPPGSHGEDTPRVAREKGKVTILKYAQLSVLSLTMPALRGNNFVRAQLGVIEV